MVKPTILPDLKSQSGNKVGKIPIVFLDTQEVLSYIPISSELFPWGELRFKFSLRIVFHNRLQEQFIAKDSLGSRLPHFHEQFLLHIHRFVKKQV